MSLALIHSRALDGFSAPEVTVEVHLANGLPSFTLVGLADTEVREARERVRSAMAQSGFEFPMNKRITVNLAPADLPKESGRFDLPIAIGILTASGQVDARAVERFEFAGELSLAGDLRPVRGALAMAHAISRSAGGRARGLVLPNASAKEAAWIRRAEVWGAQTLADVGALLAPAGADGISQGTPQGTPHGPSATPGMARVLPPDRALADRSTTRPQGPLPDLIDVRGHAAAKRALEVAAAGGHHVLLIGPPGTGKSMLAQRLPGLLPAMSDDEAVESAAIASLARDFDLAQLGQRPFRAPHHTASSAALVGGGVPPRPGEISLAHHGVLFLDELAEFSRAPLEALREPLETGRITIARAARRAEFPARFQLVAALNPCPCGHAGNPLRACRCTPDAVARYQARVSGPLLERIDLIVEVPVQSPDIFGLTPAQRPSDCSAQMHLGETPTTGAQTTDQVAARVARARARALLAQAVPNAQLTPATLMQRVQPSAEAERLLMAAAARLKWSARSLHRVWRVARTIADLDETDLGAAQPEALDRDAVHPNPEGPRHARRPVNVDDVAEAIQYRRGLMNANE